MIYKLICGQKCIVTWLYPGVAVDLVQRDRVTVVFCFRPATYNYHGVFDQRSSVEETGQGLHKTEMIQQE